MPTLLTVLDYLKAVVYGIVEGISEWLPISSTGHLILLEDILPLNMQPDFLAAFRIVIQLGAILAVPLLFFKELWPFALPGGGQQGGRGSRLRRDILQLWLKLLAACIPAAVVGLLFDDWIEAHLYHPVEVAAMLILVGILFIIIENKREGMKPVMTHVSDIGWKTAMLIGVFQVFAAVFPGVSRSGATILGALMLGVSRAAAAEFTFFLAIPVMLGASLLKLVKLDYLPQGQEMMVLLIAMLTAFLVSLAVIRFLVSFVRRHHFKPFAWYRIALGIVVLAVYALR